MGAGGRRVEPYAVECESVLHSVLADHSVRDGGVAAALRAPEQHPVRAVPCPHAQLLRVRGAWNHLPDALRAGLLPPEPNLCVGGVTGIVQLGQAVEPQRPCARGAPDCAHVCALPWQQERFSVLEQRVCLALLEQLLPSPHARLRGLQPDAV